jgi:hypothetical protein
MPLFDDSMDSKDLQRASSSEPTPEEFQGKNVNPDDPEIDPAFGADVSKPGFQKKGIVPAASSSTEKDQTEPEPVWEWPSNDLAEDELPENLWADSLNDDILKATTASAPFAFEITNLKALLKADFNRPYTNLYKPRLLWEASKAGRPARRELEPVEVIWLGFKKVVNALLPIVGPWLAQTVMVGVKVPSQLPPLPQPVSASYSIPCDNRHGRVFHAGPRGAGSRVARVGRNAVCSQSQEDVFQTIPN